LSRGEAARSPILSVPVNPLSAPRYFAANALGAWVSGMDLLSRIVSRLGENEATISAVVGIAALAGIVLAGVRSLPRRPSEGSAEKVPGAGAESLSATDCSPAPQWRDGPRSRGR
jgi:hypothetical protein